MGHKLRGRFQLPWLARNMGLPGTYAAYTIFSLLSLLFVWSRVRETKGIELEAMEG
ncbi:hypothetical protein EP837_02717 [Sphingobium sp. EP60837]|nr:hypothetical protein EP837_02717 [Sphingobium sp. EP60837]